ncbi:MAG: hypothetical protein AB1397_01685 [bacterium]
MGFEPKSLLSAAIIERIKRAKRLLDEIGVGGERLKMYNMSSSRGGQDLPRWPRR